MMNGKILFPIPDFLWYAVLLLLLIIPAACATSEQARPDDTKASVSWSEILEQSGAWYGSDQALRIADNVLLYQRTSGGWPKNIDMTRWLSFNEKAQVREKKSKKATIDNGATYTQMRYLARVYNATGNERIKDGFLRGLDYLLKAQYENGGWPQVYPLSGNYSRYITFNDDAMIGVMQLLKDVANRKSPYDFVDEERRRASEVAIEKGLALILKAQIVVDGKRMAWCAQHDPEDLRPRGARSYEHPSISGAESVGVIRYLMEIDDPGPEVVAAVQGAVAWLDRARLSGIRLERKRAPSRPKGVDKVVKSDSTASPIWARFYEIGTNRPIFSGRDGIIRYRLSEIEYERRMGYAWLGDWPRKLLEEEYPVWQKKWVPDDNALERDADSTLENVWDVR